MGYWVERGLDETAQVKTTSVIDTVAVEHSLEKDGQRYIPVGIEAVEDIFGDLEED
jgi:hypothetical protein